MNLVRAVNQILDGIIAELAEAASAAPTMDMMSISPPTSDIHDTVQDDLDFPVAGPSEVVPSPPIHLSDKYNTLRLQFAPLRRVEADLKVALGAAADEVTESVGYSSMTATPFESVASRPLTAQNRKREFCVRSHDAWKSGLNRLAASRPSDPRRSPQSTESSEVIAAFKGDIQVLWQDRTVRDVISRRRIALADSAE